jgi:hypothetical protein
MEMMFYVWGIDRYLGVEGIQEKDNLSTIVNELRSSCKHFNQFPIKKKIHHKHINY